MIQKDNSGSRASNQAILCSRRLDLIAQCYERSDRKKEGPGCLFTQSFPVTDQLAEFYQRLGVTFEYHRHGNGPYHYSGHIGPTLLEIYPLAKGQVKPDTSLRLGLTVDSFDTVINELNSQANTIHQAPTLTEWGIISIIVDPEGRKIELYKK